MHAVAALWPDAVFCLESAAALTGLPVFGDPVVVHVLSDALDTSRLTGGIRVHTTTRLPPLLDLGGIRATGLLETTIEIARSRQEAIALSVADRALRMDGTVGVEALRETNEQRASRRGRRIARWALSRAREASESPLESVSRAAVEWPGFEAPELQAWFAPADGGRDRVDMWWPSVRAIGEADGDVKYDGSIGDPVAALRARRDRDALLRAHADAIAHWG
ncbi:MAG: hypothetical protein QM604_00395 [Microbacterium sp.]